MNQKRFLCTQKPVVTFKKWGRKGYSVFSSLHKVVKIAALSSIYLTFATPANAERSLLVAINDTLEPLREVEVEEVVVSAQRAPVAFSQTARIVQIIGKEELAQAPVHDLQDLLKFASAVDVRQRSGNGVQADISIRGSSFDQVLILLNGIPLNDPQTGHHNLDLPVSFDAIDRIEILEGPAARLYGPNAFSGAVNIITSNRKMVPSLTARLSAGQFGFFESSLTSSFQTGKLANNLSGDYKRSDGALTNTDFKIGNLFYQGGWSYPTGKVELQGGYTNRSFGANEFYTPAYPNQYERIKTTFASVKIADNGFFHLAPSFYWRRNQDRFELFRDFENAPGWYTRHNYHLTDTYGANLSGWTRTQFGKLAFGTDVRNENIWSTVLGKEMSVPTKVPGESGILFDHADSRTNLSLFAEYSHHFGPIDLSGGAMANRNSALGRKWQFYPGVDVACNLPEKLKLYASYNKSLRMPTFTDLFYKSATNVGNADLQPEEAQSLETGLKFSSNWLVAHVALFERWGKNMIDWVRQPNETIWYAKNLTNLTTKGWEASVKIDPSVLLGKNIFVHSLDVTYGYMTQDKESGALISKYLLDYLKHKMDIRLSHAICKNINASWLLSYQDRNGTFTLWENNKYGNEVAYAPIWLIDTRINWIRKQFNLFVEASNLLDKCYFDYGNVEQPGLWAKAGIVVRLGL